jgi:outer membrane lipoprotein-sorting protein
MRKLTCALGALAWLATAGPAPAATPNDDAAGKLITQFLTAYDHVHSFIGHINVTTNVKSKVISSKYLLALEKPNKTMMTVLENDSMRAAVGTKVVWLGGPTCNVSTRFFGFQVKMTPRYDDSRLLGPRGDNMRDLSIVTAIAMTRDPGTRFKLVGADTVAGRPVHVVELRSPKLLSGIDHETLYLDDQIHLPFQRDMYQGGKVAYHVVLETFKFDSRLPTDTFTAE